MPNVLEEGVPLLAIVSELVAQNAEGARGVVKPTGHLNRLPSFDEEGSKSFVLPVEGFFGAHEEAGLREERYLISMIDSHEHIML
jgi:hypothetical protein